MQNATNFTFPHQTAVYHGKVRDVYTVQLPHTPTPYLVMVASNRISAFDCILPEAIPYKGQVLNQIAAHFLAATADIVPNWLCATPHSSVAVGIACAPFKVEMVIRGYLTGHAWRIYAAGGREICGVQLPEGLQQHDKLPQPIITPTTKAHEGHDEDISREAIIEQGIVDAYDYAEMEIFTRALFERGSKMAAERGLILVDTKYEFGKYEGKIYLIDEIHTPDSSRYFYADGYAERQAAGQEQRQLSKEFVREWLIANGFQGKDGQTVPPMSPEWIAEISARYIELFEQICGKKFEPQAANDQEIFEQTAAYLATL